MVTSGITSFPVVLVAWQRDGDILVQQREFAYNHVIEMRKVGVVAQNRPPSVSGVTFAVLAPFLTLKTEASGFHGKYQSHANETAIYVVSEGTEGIL